MAVSPQNSLKNDFKGLTVKLQRLRRENLEVDPQKCAKRPNEKENFKVKPQKVTNR